MPSVCWLQAKARGESHLAFTTTSRRRPGPQLERAYKTASTTHAPFFPRWSNFGQQSISGWPIISVELKNLLDGSALRSLFATRLKPNSFVGFTQTLEKKIIPLFRKQKGF
jgi:hypothetical protein